jgi:hypothetical protein
MFEHEVTLLRRSSTSTESDVQTDEVHVGEQVRKERIEMDHQPDRQPQQ